MDSFAENIRQIFSPDNRVTTEINQIRFLVVWGGIGCIIFTTYAVINFYLQDYPIAIIELLLAVIILFAVVIGVKSKQSNPATFIGLIPILIISVHNFISGGFDETGILWCYTLPLVAVFLVGKQLGFYLHVFFVMCTYLFYLLATTDSFTFLYTDFEYFMFVVTLSIVFILTYLFQTAADSKSELIEKTAQELIEKNKQLKDRLDQLGSTKKRLAESVYKLEDANKDLDEMNKTLIGRELRMIQLKKELKKQNGSSDHKEESK